MLRKRVEAGAYHPSASSGSLDAGDESRRHRYIPENITRMNIAHFPAGHAHRPRPRKRSRAAFHQNMAFILLYITSSSSRSSQTGPRTPTSTPWHCRHRVDFFCPAPCTGRVQQSGQPIPAGCVLRGLVSLYPWRLSLATDTAVTGNDLAPRRLPRRYRPDRNGTPGSRCPVRAGSFIFRCTKQRSANIKNPPCREPICPASNR